MMMIRNYLLLLVILSLWGEFVLNTASSDAVAGNPLANDNTCLSRKFQLRSLDCRNTNPSTISLLNKKCSIDKACIDRTILVSTAISVSSSQIHNNNKNKNRVSISSSRRSISDVDGYNNNNENHLFKNMLLKNGWFHKKQQWTQQVLNRQHIKFQQRLMKQVKNSGRVGGQGGDGGTKLTLLSPTPERLFRWFSQQSTDTRSLGYGIDDHDMIGKASSSFLNHNNPFNHNKPGMTNPMRHHHHKDIVSNHHHHHSNNETLSSSLSSSSSHQDNVDDDWKQEELILSSYQKSIGFMQSKIWNHANDHQRDYIHDHNWQRRHYHPSYSITDVMPVLSIHGSIQNRKARLVREQLKDEQQSSNTINSVSKNKKLNQHNKENDLGISNNDNCWWPNSDINNNNNEWRMKRYRKRVGYGHAVYEACRDAALSWEFTSELNDGGIIMIPQHHEYNNKQHINQGKKVIKKKNNVDIYDDGIVTNENNNIPNDDMASTTSSSSNFQEIWSGIGQRLVTYTRKSVGGQTTNHHRVPTNYLLQSLIPSIYAINPVQVIYNIIDQRGGFGTTYTSTAYGTLHGHAICGEERVTVCYRDNIHNTNNNNNNIHHHLTQTSNPQSSTSSSNLHHHRHDNNNNNNGAVDIEIVSYSKPSETFIGKLVWPFIGTMQENFFQQQLKAFEQVAKKTSATTTSLIIMEK